MGTLGGGEWLVILLIVLVLFGGKKLPELSRSIGSSIKEFRKATDEADQKHEAEQTTGTTPDDKE